MTSRDVSATAAHLALSLSVLLGGCEGGGSTGSRRAITDILRGREVLEYGQIVLDGRETLSLAYRTKAHLVGDWATVTREVDQVWPILRDEAGRAGVDRVRILVASETDQAPFFFSRHGDTGWTEAPRPISLQSVSGGAVVGIKEVVRPRSKDQHLSVTYVRPPGAANDIASLHREMGAVAALFGADAARLGSDAVLVSADDGILIGTKRGGLFVFDSDMKTWRPK